MTGVVVGADGSACGLQAVAVAAREALLRHCPLRVVHGFLWPYFPVSLSPSAVGPPEGGLRNEARRIVGEALEHARKAAPGVEATGEVVTGSADAVLVAESRGADLAVVGDRGLGGFGGLLLGSTGVQLSAHAGCPVLVVRGRPEPDGPVLLGVDGSPASAPAVDFAFAEAELRGVPLVALHAWTGPVSGGPGDMLPLAFDADLVAAEEERLMAEALAGARADRPGVAVEERLLRTRTRPALIEASREAQLLVVGARGRGGFTGLLLGAVSQAVLHHAECPVAVVHKR
ncbi:universal stress protein [Streptomyces sp. NPDC001380]|uniref:universal stress protein n=1 Tax=Streptomyces sp. NPDC001380 TaxID=3364566 RepID=UPI0036AA2285